MLLAPQPLARPAMPSALAKACPVFGCPSVQPCPSHAKPLRTSLTRTPEQERLRARHRGTRHQRGYDTAWDKLSAWFKAELHRLNVPRAGLCGSRLPGAPETTDSLCAQRRNDFTLGTDADHIIPFEGKDDPRRLDPMNLQLLCQACNGRKAAREARRGRRA